MLGHCSKPCRPIESLNFDGKEDFGEGCHTASTEPYYYDTATSLSRETMLDETGNETMLDENETMLDGE